MNILFIGHSLIEFFDWQERFPDHSVANLGIAGETVEGLLSRIGKITDKYRSADLAVLMTGLNNMAMDDFGFFGALAEAIERLRAAYPSARIVLSSILPTALEFIPNESVRGVNDKLRNLARDSRIEFMDIYNLFVDGMGAPIKDLFLDDGVHLSDRGYSVWSKALETAL